MALVGYSDSEESDQEEVAAKQNVPAAPLAPTLPSTSFVTDKSNRRKIKINLQDALQQSNAQDVDDEPAAKRARTDTRSLRGFNSMLPAPKRDGMTTDGGKTLQKGPPRKAFSLKTGAEPGFNRESDAELRQFFVEHASETPEA